KAALGNDRHQFVDGVFLYLRQQIKQAPPLQILRQFFVVPCSRRKIGQSQRRAKGLAAAAAAAFVDRFRGRGPEKKVR
ncbi:MAG: hypothetical protein IIC53_11325, partial [Proteobacteria bacterium]|nr:hypothetical protein [Pseudomonadota bacterium]